MFEKNMKRILMYEAKQQQKFLFILPILGVLYVDIKISDELEFQY